jgi:pimeloyl-ACP methyl ester carboxylesterase
MTDELRSAVGTVWLNHVRQGQGEPLLLLHSLGGSLIQWSPVLDRLAEEREVIAVDMPGFGESPELPEGVAPRAANLATAVLDFYDALGVEGKPAVAGISLGGWVALEMAAQGEARSVTAIAPAGLWSRALGPRPNPARTAARAALPILPLALASPRVRRIALAGIVAHPDRVPVADAIRLVAAYARSTGYDAANAAMRAGRFTGFDQIDVPLTLAWPDHDRLVGRPSRLPANARNVVLRDCGHVPTWDDPEQVARLLLRPA